MPTCRACGAGAPDDARYCPTCGSPFAAALGPPAPAPAPPPAWPQEGMPPMPPAPAPAPPGPPARARPLGVTILSILDILGALVLVVAGLFLLALGPAVVSDPQFQQELARQYPGDPADFGAMVGFFGGLSVALGLVLAPLGWGLWQGRGWAWTLAVALEFVWIAFGLAQIVALQDASAVVGLAVNGFILWYFLQPGVKRWFGKAEPEAAMPGYVPPPSPPPLPP